ncbi:MAG: hypothetical protein EKK61_05550 [Rickettsiales bacterium]|nr:MAG: hypothetical protein EKK61_05550 [Rickettsiales bacterium]
MIVNVICMKWGTKYTATDVNILHSMVKRHLTIPHRFICLTDDISNINSEIDCFDLPQIDVPIEKDVSPWRKLGMFSDKIGDLSGKALFLDLDIVIMDNIDCFFTYSDKFTIIENWTQKGQGIGNSSVYCFTIGAHSDVIDYYKNNIEEVTNAFSNEQIYLSKKIKDIEFWPDSWCKSFKRHCLPPYIIRYFQAPYQPQDVKIVVFHGNPKPEDAITGGFFGNIWKYVKPTKWIAENWR